MTSLVLSLIQPFDPHAPITCDHRPFVLSLSIETMNHPYMFPEDAPWTDDYKELHQERERYFPRAFDDEEEFLDALYGVV